MLLAINRYGTPVRLPEKERRASTLAAECQAQEDEDLLRTAQQHRIADALQCLTARERLIVRQFYGIDTDRLSLTEIAQSLGVSKARASALHSRALQKLESALMERPLVDYLAPWLDGR